MPDSPRAGQRLSFDGALCTVRYHGPLPAAKGDWLGVEWDNADRGKHDGTHHGQRIFQCVSSKPTAASFIRPSRVSDPTRTVIEALKFKYGSRAPTNGAPKPDTYSNVHIVHISGKAVEEVGFDKIQKQIGHFEQLKVVLLDALQVSGLAVESSGEAEEAAAREFAETCPNIVELDLGWNLFNDWQTIAYICEHLQNLRVLKTSGLRLASLNSQHDCEVSPFARIEELHLSETLLGPDRFLTMLARFPNIKTLYLSSNEYSYFESGTDITVPSLTSLKLEDNLFTDQSSLSHLFRHFPSLTDLSLQSNRISAFSLPVHDLNFPSLTHLSLTDNNIQDFKLISHLPTIFPSLTSLQISRNPLYTSVNSSGPSDAAYYLTLARIPTLTTLNHTSITPRDREEGEIYYLSIAEKDITNILSTSGLAAATKHTTTHYSRYTELCLKYDRPSILASPPQLTSSPNYPPGSLASRVVQCNFFINHHSLFPSDPTSTLLKDDLNWHRPLPKTISVYQIKAMISRYYGLAPLQFKLIYESPELDPIPETTRKINDGPEDWARWGDWDVDIPAPGHEGAIEKDQEVEAREGKWIGDMLYKDGAKWKKRETEIVDGFRSWGDYLDGGEKEARIRVEPKDGAWWKQRDRWKGRVSWADPG